MPKLCLIGLGNPGSKYNHTRHNIGKDWLIAASKPYCDKFSYKEKFQAEIATSHSDEILWVIPDNYVNNSGKTVMKLMKNMNLKEDRIIIFHDDLDLNPGEVRLKEDGGHGGHNGLRDIIKALGSKNFYRLRIGIEHPGSKNEVVDYVLNAPSKSELSAIQESMSRASNIVELLVKGSFEDAMKALHT